MAESGRREGFKAQKVFRLNRDQIDHAVDDSLFADLYVTDIGYFPQTTNHLVDRLQSPLRECVLIYCIGGEGWYEVNDRRSTVRAGQFIVIPSGTPHRYGSEGGWRVYWVHFGGIRSDTVLARLAPAFDESHTGPEATEAVEVFERMIRRAEDGLTMINADFLHYSVWHLLGLFALRRPSSAEAPVGAARMEACISYMKEHVASGLTLQQIAEHGGYSVSHFAQRFRQHTGYPPVDFYIQLKIQHAGTLLATTDLRVYEIAARCGYDNPYYFSRLFRKVTGHSPKRYRQRFRV